MLFERPRAGCLIVNGRYLRPAAFADLIGQIVAGEGFGGRGLVVRSLTWRGLDPLAAELATRGLLMAAVVSPTWRVIGAPCDPLSYRVLKVMHYWPGALCAADLAVLSGSAAKEPLASVETHVALGLSALARHGVVRGRPGGHRLPSLLQRQDAYALAT